MTDEPIANTPENNLAIMLGLIFGTDCWDDTPYDTAERIVRYWKEYSNPKEYLFEFTTFPATEQQLIVVKDIEFSSICAHHLLPFFGKAHIGYLPHMLMVGLSKIPRTVNYFAKRPQVQERLTGQIAEFLKRELKAKGVAVVITARHTCMSCRGVQTFNGWMTTSDMRGLFLTSPLARGEFMELIK